MTPLRDDPERQPDPYSDDELEAVGRRVLELQQSLTGEAWGSFPHTALVVHAVADLRRMLSELYRLRRENGSAVEWLAAAAITNGGDLPVDDLAIVEAPGYSIERIPDAAGGRTIWRVSRGRPTEDA